MEATIDVLLASIVGLSINGGAITLGGAHMAQFELCAAGGGSQTSQRARCLRHVERSGSAVPALEKRRDAASTLADIEGEPKE